MLVKKSDAIVRLQIERKTAILNRKSLTFGVLATAERQHDRPIEFDGVL